MPEEVTTLLTQWFAKMFESQMADRQFLMALRQIALQFVDAVERKLEIYPRTSSLRHEMHRRVEN